MGDVIQSASPSRILVVEDEPAISDVVSTALRHHGHAITTADDGRRGLDLARSGDFDLIVLDVMLPGMNGYEVCRDLRSTGSATPVLFLTARDAPDDRIEGFLTGGDDYLTKPFSVDELMLRVAAILRRTGREAPSDRLTVADLVLDPSVHEVRRDGRLIELSPTEFRLLHYLMVNTGTVLSKAQILVNVWDHDDDVRDNVVELYIGYLRRKVDDDHRALIHTRRGIGYLLRSEVSE